MSLVIRAEIYWVDILDNVKRHFFDFTLLGSPKWLRKNISQFNQ